MTDNDTPPDYGKCECRNWATVDVGLMTLTEHHPGCKHAKPIVPAFRALLAELVAGIEREAGETDGVSEWLWKPYVKAVFITRGEVLSDDR